MRRIGIHGLFLAVVLAMWQWAAVSGLLNPDLVPAPLDVGWAVIALIGRAEVRHSIGVTFASAALAFAISLPLGLVLGVALARSARMGAALTPLVNFLFGVPKSIFLPIFILVFGIGIEQKVAFAVFSTTFIILVASAAAVRGISSELTMISRAFGANAFQTTRLVIVPAIAPVLIEAARLAFIFNLTSILLAEMYAAKDGLGTRMAAWGEAQNMAPLFAGLAIVAAFAVLINECLALFERKAGAWRRNDSSTA